MRTTLLLAFLLAAAPAAATAHELTAAAWSVPRDGAAVRTMAPLPRVMQELAARPDARLVIRYPGGDEGTVWARELAGWLTALGLASARMELIPGSRAADVLELEVRPPADGRRGPARNDNDTNDEG